MKVSVDKEVFVAQLSDEIRKAYDLESPPLVSFNPVTKELDVVLPSGSPKKKLENVLTKHIPDPDALKEGWYKRLRTLLTKEVLTTQEEKEAAGLMRMERKRRMEREELSGI